MNARLLVALLVIAGTSSKAAAFLPNADEAVLRASGMDTRNETLLKFLGEARFNDAQLARLETLILQLGAARFADRTTAFREITRLGPAAELALRKAIDHPDAELRSGARRCLAQRVFQTPPPMLLRLAVRVLVRRQAPGAVSAMLGRLPYAHPGGELETELAFGIDRLVCGSRQMPSELLDALTDAQPARRAIAACIVGSRGTSAQRQRVKPLLNDPVPMVRLRAAQGLLIAADKDAVPVLIALLDATERPEALQAEDLLRWIAGPLAPERKSIVGTGGEMAQQCRRVWDKWWQDQRNSLDMVASTRRPRGPGLFALWDENNGSFSSGIYGCDGNIRFDLSIIGASRGWQVLPNGRLLISGHERRGVAPGGSMLSIRDVDWSGMVHHAYDAPWGVGSNITLAEQLRDGSIHLVFSQMAHIYLTAAWEETRRPFQQHEFIEASYLPTTREVPIPAETRLGNGHRLRFDARRRRVVKLNQRSEVISETDYAGPLGSKIQELFPLSHLGFEIVKSTANEQ